MKESIKAWLQANATNEVKATEIEELFKREQRDLLIDFFIFFRNKGEENIGMTIEEFVDNYINTK